MVGRRKKSKSVKNDPKNLTPLDPSDLLQVVSEKSLPNKKHVPVAKTLRKKTKPLPVADALREKRSTVLKLLIEKFKYELDCLKTEKDVILLNRENILLHTDILKLKQEKLEEEISKFKKSSTLASPIDEIVIDLEKVETEDSSNLSPYILLTPLNNKDTHNDKCSRQVYVNTLFDIDIKEYFELVSTEPFKICPLNNEIPIKEEYLQQLKPHVLKWATTPDKNIPKISLVSESPKKQHSKLSHHSTAKSVRVIDLTSENNTKEEKTNSCKRKRLETDITFSREQKKGNEILISEIQIDDTSPLLHNNNKLKNEEENLITMNEDVIEIS